MRYRSDPPEIGPTLRTKPMPRSPGAALDALDPADLRWHLPLLGPTSTLLLPALIGPDDAPTDLDVASVAWGLGVGVVALRRALGRLVEFRYVRAGAEDLIFVRRWLDRPTFTRSITVPPEYESALSAFLARKAER